MIVTSSLKLWGREPILVGRCNTCGVLVIINSQASLSTHAGHFVKQPCNVSLTEIILLWIGWIK